MKERLRIIREAVDLLYSLAFVDDEVNEYVDKAYEFLCAAIDELVVMRDERD